jgi:hypothetical protein
MMRMAAWSRRLRVPGFAVQVVIAAGLLAFFVVLAK